MSSFVPPSRSQTLEAIGLRRAPGQKATTRECMQLQDTLAYPKAQREDKAFIQGLHASLIPHEEDFPPMPEPDEYDWLYDRAAKGQSFRSFVQNHAKRQPKPGANKIYLLPIVEQVGEHALARFPDVETLRSMVEAFYSLPTIILKPVSMAGLGGRIGTS